MTDRVRKLTIFLDGDYRTDGMKRIVEAIEMVKGVMSVEEHVVEAEDYMARAIVGNEARFLLSRAIRAVLGDGEPDKEVRRLLQRQLDEGIL